MMRYFPITPSLPDVSNKLRVALLLASAEQPAWLYSMVERVRGLSFADICLVIYDRSAASPKPHTEDLFWRLYQGLDKRLFGKGADPLRPRDLGVLLNGVAVCELGMHVTASAEAAVAAQGLDVIIHLGSGRPHPALFGAARYGVWGHAFGTRRAAESAVVGLREVIEREPLSVAMLIRFSQDGHDQTIYSSYSRTIPF